MNELGYSVNGTDMYTLEIISRHSDYYNARRSLSQFEADRLLYLFLMLADTLV